jgi:hypothetical protein
MSIIRRRPKAFHACLSLFGPAHCWVLRQVGRRARVIGHVRIVSPSTSAAPVDKRLAVSLIVQVKTTAVLRQRIAGHFCRRGTKAGEPSEKPSAPYLNQTTAMSLACLRRLRRRLTPMCRPKYYPRFHTGSAQWARYLDLDRSRPQSRVPRLNPGRSLA